MCRFSNNALLPVLLLSGLTCSSLIAQADAAISTETGRDLSGSVGRSLADADEEDDPLADYCACLAPCED